MATTPYGGSVSGRSRYDDRYTSAAPAQHYYPGTYIQEEYAPSQSHYPEERHESRGHEVRGHESRAYRTYADKEYRKEGIDYVTTKEPFKPESDYYQKEYKRPYVYRDNRLYHTKDPVRKYYDGSGNIQVTILEPGEQQTESKDNAQYAKSSSGGSTAVRQKFYPAEERQHEKKQEVEVGYLVEHLASFDIGDDHDPGQAGQNIEAAIETLRNMDQDNSILPLRCYLTYKDQEIQILSDKELSVLEWIKYDDVNLVSAEVHQLTRYEEILLVQVKEVIHLFCPLGDLHAEELARNIKERISKRRDHQDDQSRSSWQEDQSNDRYLLNDQTLKAESDVDFYDKYTMQLYGRATRDYVARNDKELTVMSGERVEIQSTRGQWWLARTSNGKSGYCPAECLESYVPAPTGLPKTILPAHRSRSTRDDVSERASTVYSSASSRPRATRDSRDYQDYGRRDDRRDNYDRRDDRRDYDRRDDRRDFERPSERDPPRRESYDDSFECRARSVFKQQGGFAGTGTGLGTGAGFGTGFGNGLGTPSLIPGLGNGLGTIGPSGLGTVGPSGFGTVGPSGFGTVGPSGFGTVGPSGFGTVGPSSATSAGLFPPGFTAQLQGSMRGNPMVGMPTLGAANLGTPTFGAATLGGQTLGAASLRGVPTIGTPNLGGVQLGGLGGVQLGGLGGVQGIQLGQPNLGLGQPRVVGMRPMGTVTRTVPAIGAPTLGFPGLGGNAGYRIG